jgi:thiol:disulfide interchange protein DsbD
MRKLIFLTSIFLFLIYFSETSFAARAPHLEVDLITRQQVVSPGDHFDAGLYFRLENNWHIYWQNAGDSGEAPQIEWQLPQNVKAGPILWPAPQRIQIGPLVNFGYEKEVLLPIPLEVSSTFSNNALELKAKVKWLVCREECVPGEVLLKKRIHVSSEGHSILDPQWKTLFDAAQQLLPQNPPSNWKATGLITQNDFVLSLKSSDFEDVSDVSFYPKKPDQIKNQDKPIIQTQPNSIEIRVSQSDRLVQMPSELPGIVTLLLKSGESKSFEVTFPLSRSMKNDQIPFILLLAFLGGVILNLMPCVFPVLSIKVMSLIHLSGKEKATVIKNGWAYTLGILVSFWILVTGLLLLRAAGSQLGWGFQLQSPQFVFSLSCLLFVFGINLLGIFEIPSTFMGAGSSLAHQKGYLGSFFTGALATLVATPCTAPFMGSAIGFALTQNALITFFIFTTLALGLASPFLLISYWPNLGLYLPKPGPWMETFKQLMAFLILGTVLWLTWLLGIQTGAQGPVYLFGAFLLMSFGIWLSKIWKKATLLIIVIVIASLAWIMSQFTHPAQPALTETHSDLRSELQWEKFTPEKLSEYRSQGRAVFIDFTAAWCVSCQVNELLVFRSAEVKQKLKTLNIVLMKADWTNHDPMITQTLNSFGRNGVPVYVLYGKEKNAPAILLPEVITAGIVLKHLEEIQ